MGAGVERRSSSRELALFLRARRAVLQPEAIGLARGERRRVPGLRREEVALRAGVSTTWYTWLEQGRDIKPGPTALDAVCRALCLNEDERAYVRGLAGHPLLPANPVPTALDPSVSKLVLELAPNPACVATGSYDLIAWNEPYVKVFTDPTEIEPNRRNLLWISFDPAQIRRRTGDWVAAYRTGVAFARAEFAKRPNNARFREVIRSLCDESAEFRQAWEHHEVRHAPELADALMHDELGELRFRIVVLSVLNKPTLNVIVFQPADEDSRRKLCESTGSSRRASILST